MRHPAKTLMVVVASAPLAMAGIGPAHAGKPVTYEYSTVNASFVHLGAIDGLDGNAHLVDFYGDPQGYADGYVVSFDCAGGAVPSWEEETDCQFVGEVQLSGGDMAVTIDPDLTVGTIAGVMDAYVWEGEAHEPTPVGAFAVDLSVAGTGEVISDSGKEKGLRYSYMSRSGTATGSLDGTDLGEGTGWLEHSSESYRDSNKYRDRYSGEQVFLHWIELGELPGGVAGNAHVGQMWAGTDGWAEGQVVDWTCPEGELPPTGGGGHGEEFEEEPETNCIEESVRFIWADETLNVTMDKKLTKATITGTLNVEAHGGGAGGTPPVDITVSGDGPLSSYSYRDKWSDEWGSGTERYSSSSRAGVVDGFIGAMGFTDDADDISTAEMSAWKGMYQESVN